MTRLAVPVLLAAGWLVCARRLATTRTLLAEEREVVGHIGATIDTVTRISGQARYAAGYKAGHAKGYADALADSPPPLIRR